ncbi:hypothetical protein HPP92_029027 [Vanilla planifolia]|uniref:Uncharacterized protein n=1 Tax=Vanilla planifolia TaxID=51239 RepID=A0A835U4Q9_VANPL|nr:hypothetical protein HPP92_029027 [Vanilla planifolia]KAG0446066.1 hypothetical protein HPP92_029015 [Vanilla planifolia]
MRRWININLINEKNYLEFLKDDRELAFIKPEGIMLYRHEEPVLSLKNYCTADTCELNYLRTNEQDRRARQDSVLDSNSRERMQLREDRADLLSMAMALKWVFFLGWTQAVHTVCMAVTKGYTAKLENHHSSRFGSESKIKNHCSFYPVLPSPAARR